MQYKVKLFKDNITGECSRENVWVCDNLHEVAGVMEMGSQNGFSTFIVSK